MLIPSVESGGVLISRAVASQVPSALRGLTSVFGMGTGGSLLPSSPELLQALAFASLVSASLLARFHRSRLPFALLARFTLSLARFTLSFSTFKTAQRKADLENSFPSIFLGADPLFLLLP